ncbi:MAG: hypothetical protein ABMB14_32360, partial [Myxococcota bacterium]
VYDATCVGRRGNGLTPVWWTGAYLYGGLGRLDAWTGARSWPEALAWLGTVCPDRPIAEIQYWGHGHWGEVMLGDTRIDGSSTAPASPLRPALERIRDRMVPGDASGTGSGTGAAWWFRTCDTFGSARGHAFAQRWTALFGRPAAGFTHVIGPWQSGLHRLAPGDAPHWPASEGIAIGTPDAPKLSTGSRPGLPNTITFLQNRVPPTW